MEITSREVDRETTSLGELILMRYEASSGESGFEILLDGHFLMASHGSHSERAMADLALSRLAGPPRDLSVLIGGLGAGHTLRATLDLPGISRVVVVEIGARLVDWNRTHFANVNQSAIDDPRVEVRVADVYEVLQSSRAEHDLVLLDVDNGPGWLAAPSNARLYERSGIAASAAALRHGGVLAVWSPQRNPLLRTALSATFAAVEEIDTSSLGRACGEPGSIVYLSRGAPAHATDDEHGIQRSSRGFMPLGRQR